MDGSGGMGWKEFVQCCGSWGWGTGRAVTEACMHFDVYGYGWLREVNGDLEMGI